MIRVEKFFIYCDGELHRNRRRSSWTRFHEGRRSLWQAHVWRDSFPWLHESWINLGRKLRWKGMSRNRFGGCGGDGSGEEARSLSQHGGVIWSLENICSRSLKFTRFCLICVLFVSASDRLLFLLRLDAVSKRMGEGKVMLFFLIALTKLIFFVKDHISNKTHINTRSIFD